MINKIAKLLEKIHNKPVIELIQKLVVLDANVELTKKESINVFLADIKHKIKSENIWGIDIIDKFPLKEKIRYTIRVSYKGLSDQEAKKDSFRCVWFNFLEKILIVWGNRCRK